MTNKIDAYNNASLATSRAAAKPGVAPATGTGSSSAGKAKEVAPVDKVSLTSDAHQLQQLEKTIAAIPVADHARVSRVKTAIANGSYKVDSQDVARKIARAEWELRGN